MINFFRKIRKKLADDNQFFKYARYAIGEIFLVVVGILIALQINNWNEERKERNQEEYLLTQLQKEFVKDSLNLQRIIVLSDIKTKYGKILKKIVKERNPWKLDSLVMAIFYNGRLLQFDSYTPTYDEIVSTGKSSIIRGEQLKYLVKFYKQELSKYQRVIYDDNQKRKSDYNAYIRLYFEPEINTYLRMYPANILVSELQSFGMDIDGFMNDPRTIQFINDQIGVDSELNLHLKETIMPEVADILGELRKEIAIKNK